MQWKFLIVDNAIDIYIGLVAVFFTLLGIWVATQLIKPKTKVVFIRKEIYSRQISLMYIPIMSWKIALKKIYKQKRLKWQISKKFSKIPSL